jgi:hypothetical protein
LDAKEPELVVDAPEQSILLCVVREIVPSWFRINFVETGLCAVGGDAKQNPLAEAWAVDSVPHVVSVDKNVCTNTNEPVIR